MRCFDRVYIHNIFFVCFGELGMHRPRIHLTFPSMQNACVGSADVITGFRGIRFPSIRFPSNSVQSNPLTVFTSQARDFAIPCMIDGGEQAN